ncbi:MAG: secondary thiamine-phosphate synthase enzyme YjbQ [Candidatus Micrarchaeota archaeon]|nr:secondary thiamine-phosphate synthase enzyme YjbQ [Candidatus Micrarchaeota archaeon]
MTVKTVELYFEKPVEDLYIIDITKDVQKSIDSSRIRNGIATVFIGCSTASISTMKHEPRSLKEMHEALERLAPSGADYLHHRSVADINGIGADNNGKSHVRSALLGPSITVPLKDGKLMLDRDQDIVVLDFDIIKRKRKVILQVMGE